MLLQATKAIRKGTKPKKFPKLNRPELPGMIFSLWPSGTSNT